MGKFKEFFKKQMLVEMPVAMQGDWFFEECNYLMSKSLSVLEKEWDLIKTFDLSKKMNFYQLKNKLDFILGYEDFDKEYSETEDELRLIIVARISLDKKDDFEKKLQIKNIAEVKSVAVLSVFRGEGIAKKIYKFLTELGFNILSDGGQFLGARRLWSRLSQETSSLSVDVIDLEKVEIIEKNVKIKHGKLDNEFDEKYWSPEINPTNISKFKIRFLLRKIN